MVSSGCFGVGTTRSGDVLAHVARECLSRHRGSWEIHPGGVWTRVQPSAEHLLALPPQGWKLHISATQFSAPGVLTSVMPILLEEAVPFKFASTLEGIKLLNAADAPRESAGKFITVYPLGDDQARRIAERCHEATLGLDGPAILSDRRLKPGSLVHYRYGGFWGGQGYDDDGAVVYLIRDPQGNAIPDERHAWFQPPPWARDPFQPSGLGSDERDGDPPPSAGDADAAGAAVLLNGRYLVRQALQHLNRGGVYLADDDATGRQVVIKEARPHVGSEARLVDARGRLRHEARMLRHVAHLGHSPRPIEVFEQEDHVFLVEQFLEGTPLRRHISARFAAGGRGLQPQELMDLIRGLARMMGELHTAGVLLRDFGPNNLLVGPGAELRLVDFEFADFVHQPVDPLWSGGTLGYVSPEQVQGRCSGFPDDYYSLGATLVFAGSGIDPYLMGEAPRSACSFERLEAWLLLLERDGLMAPPLLEVALGCMAEDPQQRWGPARILELLGSAERIDAGPHRRRRRSSFSIDDLRGLPLGICRRLVGSMRPGADDFLWPPSPGGAQLDPCAVQAGAGGVGLFLCQASRLLGAPGLPEAVAETSRWICRQMANGPSRSPGLYFGSAGVAWFLAEAARLLDEDGLMDRATEIALALPVAAANPDITHGTAGIGLCHLHQWLVGGSKESLGRAVAAAEHLVESVWPSKDGLVWQVPATAPSALAGLTSYGFAHGNAGICSFLLCAGRAAGEERFVQLALAGIDTLLGAATVVGDAAFWGVGPGRTEAWPHWCNGSSGIGTALLRAHAVTGDDRYRRMAERAARAVLREKWRSSCVACHGLAGNGEFLLDLHQFLGDEQFFDLAVEVAEAIYAHGVRDRGAVVFPDETGGEVSPGFNTGLAGTGAFLLRLTHGGPRPLMLDSLLVAGLAPASATAGPGPESQACGASR